MLAACIIFGAVSNEPRENSRREDSFLLVRSLCFSVTAPPVEAASPSLRDTFLAKLTTSPLITVGYLLSFFRQRFSLSLTTAQRASSLTRCRSLVAVTDVACAATCELAALRKRPLWVNRSALLLVAFTSHSWSRGYFLCAENTTPGNRSIIGPRLRAVLPHPRYIPPAFLIKFPTPISGAKLPQQFGYSCNYFAWLSV